ncbi:hypothetical protein GOV09_03390 [Candidatus Woesearchaeota archaeon]|nr:hypothetical protein [Candidatus Woesearchaeota archaeon]
MHKKALSPLVATVLLVVFALIVGTATMSWANNKATIGEDDNPVSIVIDFKKVDTPLKRLQIDYITDEITLEEYLEKEQELLG